MNDRRARRVPSIVWPLVLLATVIGLGLFAAERVARSPVDAAVGSGAVVATTALDVVSTTSAVATTTTPSTTAASTTTTAAPFDVGLILEGSEWELDAWVNPDDAEAVPRGIRDSTLQFEGGVATVDTSCNTGSADYTISGNQVTFASLVLTELACDPLAAMVEESIVDTLDGTTTVSFAAGVLFIDRDDYRLVYLADRRD